MKKRVFSAFLAAVLAFALILPGLGSAQAAGTKLVAITFDDGPGRYTNELLDGLAKRGAKATFFCLGQNAASYPNTLQRIVSEGHQLASHTYSHSNLPSIGTSAAIAEVEKTNKLYNSTIGGNENFMIRAPYGNSTADFRSKVKSPLFYWSVDTRDWEYRNATTVTNNILNNAYDGAIILLHDIYSTSVRGALDAIDILQDRGYEFVTVRELFHRRYVTPENGTVYYDCKPKGGQQAGLSAPVISVTASAGGSRISITGNEGVPIYYTTDGSPIGYGSSTYSGPFTVTGPCTIRAVSAYHLNGGRSPETKYEYTLPPASNAQIDVSDGVLSFGGVPENETVYYTLDGGDPTKNGTAYSGPVSITAPCTVSFYTAGANKIPTKVRSLHYSERENLFADVWPGKWYYDAADVAFQQGFMNGVEQYTFQPNGALTRAMVVTILYRMSGDPSPASITNPFKDVASGKYYAEAVEWAYQNSIVNGMTAVTFEPNRSISRQEMAQMLVRYLDYQGADLPDEAPGAADGYGDRKQISGWALKNVEIITSIGLMQGNEKGNFCPRGTATRAEGATVLCRMYDMLNSASESE